MLIKPVLTLSRQLLGGANILLSRPRLSYHCTIQTDLISRHWPHNHSVLERHAAIGDLGRIAKFRVMHPNPEAAE